VVLTRRVSTGFPKEAIKPSLGEKSPLGLGLGIIGILTHSLNLTTNQLQQPLVQSPKRKPYSEKGQLLKAFQLMRAKRKGPNQGPTFLFDGHVRCQQKQRIAIIPIPNSQFSNNENSYLER